MLRSGDVGPHVYLRRCFATPTESQVTDITQLHYEADTKQVAGREALKLARKKAPRNATLFIGARQSLILQQNVDRGNNLNVRICFAV